MKIKDFFQKKYLIFYLAVISFIFLMISALVIGLEVTNSRSIITLPSIAKKIKDLNQAGIKPPKFLINTYGLIITGLIFSGLSLVLFFTNLLPVPKIDQAKNWLWWIGIILVLSAFVLVMSGEGSYVQETMKNLDPSTKFGDLFTVSRFVGLVICIVTWPLTTVICGTIWSLKLIKTSAKAKPTKKS